MKKIIILAIALLSTGIVVSETIQRKDMTVKTATLKIEKSTVSEKNNIANDAIATAD